MSEEETEAALPPSKSQRKREAHALQSLGKKLTSLREKDLAKIPITDEIRSALQEYKDFQTVMRQEGASYNLLAN